MFFATLLNSLCFVRILLYTFCSKFILFVAKTLFLFTTVNGLVLFSIYSRLLNFPCFNYTQVTLLGQNYLFTNLFFSFHLITFVSSVDHSVTCLEPHFNELQPVKYTKGA